MRIEAGGTQLFFDVVGSQLEVRGPALVERPQIVMIHGGPGADHSLLRPEFDSLADIAQVIYLDLRGHGRSAPGAPGQWTLARWGEDVARFCETLHLERPVIFGSSFGGFVALEVATRWPSLPGALILSSTAARVSAERIGAAFGRLGGVEVQAVAERFFSGDSSVSLDEFLRVCGPFYRRNPPDPRRFSRAIERPAVSDWFFRPGGEALTLNYVSRLSAIECPVLITVGEDDPVTTPADADELAAGCRPGLAEVVRFAGCGHLVTWENPAAELTAIRAFLARHAKTDR